MSPSNHLPAFVIIGFLIVLFLCYKAYRFFKRLTWKIRLILFLVGAIPAWFTRGSVTGEWVKGVIEKVGSMF